MRYIHLSDCHTHSNISFDGHVTPREMVERAVEIGLYCHAITDHCECHIYFDENHRNVVTTGQAEMAKLKEEFSGKIRFLSGIELGQPTQDLKAAEDALAGSNYDMVLGSLHNLRGCEDFYFWNKPASEVPEAMDRYFAELHEMLDWGKFDTLTHLTYPLRYIVGECGIDLDFTKYYDRVESVYKKLIEKGIALEINTSGLNMKIGETLPNETLLKMYRQMGGELITVGSDAHVTEKLAQGMEQGFDILKNVGFKYFTIFEQRKPQFITIE